jgi:hypothetical protein
MFNETLKKYDISISIRQVLKTNKMNINWMNLIAWSSEICREIKRMWIRVVKKRASKTQSQDVIMRYSQQQSDFVSQQANFLSQNFFQFMSAQYMQSMISQQQFQNFQQSIVSDFIESQILQNSDITSSAFTNANSSVEEILSISTDSKNDKHIQFLNTIIEMNKVFRISCFVIKSSDEIIALNKQYTQTNQKSDMNVISMNWARRLDLQLRDLAEMKFRELFMKTADNHDTILYHWVWVRVFVAEILRDIRCFVVSKIMQIIVVDQIEHLSLILRLSWLYSVDAFISIRKFKITIDDVTIDETMRKVVSFELVFCKNHNLLMYSKFVMTSSEKNSIVEDVFESSDSDFSENDLFDVNDSSDENF